MNTQKSFMFLGLVLVQLVATTAPVQAEQAPKAGDPRAAPLCLVVGQAALDAPNQFKKLRGKKLSTFMAETRWESTIALPGTPRAVVMENSQTHLSEWSNTLFKTDKPDLAKKGHGRLVQAFKECALPGLVGPKVYPPDKNLHLAVWLLPQADIAVEIRNTRLGKDWTVAIFVRHGLLSKKAAGPKKEPPTIKIDLEKPPEKVAKAQDVPQAFADGQWQNLCEAVKEAVQHAPSDFGPLKKGSAKKTLGYPQLWDGATQVLQAKNTKVGISGRRTLWWTELSFDKDESVTDAKVDAVIKYLKKCRIPKAKAVKKARDKAGLIRAIWQVPRQKAYVQVRKNERGSSHDIRVEVIPTLPELSAPRLVKRKTQKRELELCSALKAAMREHPSHFAAFRGNKLLGSIGLDQWRSSLKVKGHATASAGYEQGRNAPFWQSTLPGVKDAATAERNRLALVNQVNTCRISGKKKPRFFTDKKNSLKASWLLPREKLVLELHEEWRSARFRTAIRVVKGVFALHEKETRAFTTEMVLSETQEIKYENGDVYKGKVNAKGLPHGKGKFSNAKTNTWLEGEFANGKPIRGKRYVKKGVDGRYEGELNEKGQMHGQGVVFDKNGYQLSGRFKNDQPEGTMVYANPGQANFIEARGHFRLGSGLYGQVETRVFNPKDKKTYATAQGYFKEGKPDGTHKLYDGLRALKQQTTYKEGRVISGGAIYGEGNALLRLAQTQYQKVAPFPLNDLVNKARGELRQQNLRLVLDRRVRIQSGRGAKSPRAFVGTFNVSYREAFVLSVQADKRKVPGFRFLMQSKSRSRRTSEQPCRLTEQNICFLKVRADQGPMDISIYAVGNTQPVDAHVLAADLR
jgi:hypothetical protein